MLRSRLPRLAAFALAATGCGDVFGTKDAHHPGDPLGTFHVAAKLDTTTCGDGSLGSTPAWEFDVKLSRDAQQIYWNNGQETLTGAVAADGVSFTFKSSLLMNMRTDTSPKNLPACSVARSDDAAGVLAVGTPAPGFSGTLGYSFDQAPGSSCTDLLAPPTELFVALPCAMTYALGATRTGD
jgi:hypothetical protein